VSIETVTVEPSAAVQWGDWCHLPADDGYPETFVCLSPGSAIHMVRYWPVDETPAVARVYRSERVILGSYVGAQADALREQLLRRLPLIHDEGDTAE
jgi:hypothetical protein